MKFTVRRLYGHPRFNWFASNRIITAGFETWAQAIRFAIDWTMADYRGLMR
jgi:hypothetical protein